MTRFFADILACVCVLFFLPRANAQDQTRPAVIRVESDEVLVPVLVLDKVKVDALQRGDPSIFNPNGEIIRSFFDVAVEGLASTDFHVFEDGQEQIIEKMIFGPHQGRVVRDSLGEYSEVLEAGGGVSIALGFATGKELVDEGTKLVLRDSGVQSPDPWEPPISGYLIAFIPPHSLGGACHKISVKVDRPNTMVYALNGYCAGRGSLPYSLSGTPLAEQMKSQLSSGKTGSIPVSLRAVTLLSETRELPVQVSLEFPPQSLALKGKECVNADSLQDTMHLLGVFQAERDGESARFGEMLPMARDFFGMPVPALYFWQSEKYCIAFNLVGYEKQMYLAPGQYSLGVVFGNGKSFGRAEIPVTVETQDDQHLALSDIVLAKRIAPAPTPDDALTGTYVPLVSHGVEYTPTANLNFKKKDPFLFYLEVRGPSSGKRSSAAIWVRLRIVDAKSGAVVRNLAALNATDFAVPGNPIIPVGSGIHIEDLPAGQYRLEAQATTLSLAPLSGSVSVSQPPPAPAPIQTTAWRSASFTIQN